ncbi:MAG: hypothetical protein QOD69_1208 [Solirubrobacteraceae bacterium]|jgi:hypothetical protein|nr:hypothetical protein [Solirubrobacteraceae bacterium]
MVCERSADSERDRYGFGVFSVVDPMDRHARPLRKPARTRHSEREASRPRQPRWLFKVVDVVTGTTIVEDACARTTIATLAAVESIFDVWIFVWIPDLAMWRQLTPGEHRILWDFRGR